MQRFSSIFSQLLQLFSRNEFELAVKKHQSDYSANGVTSWGQFVAMRFCQFGRAHSLRIICGILPVAPANSNISEHLTLQSARHYLMLMQIVRGCFTNRFRTILAICQIATAGRRTRKKFRFKNKLVSLDSSVLDKDHFF
jgi:hypothetical protein